MFVTIHPYKTHKMQPSSYLRDKSPGKFNKRMLDLVTVGNLSCNWNFIRHGNMKIAAFRYGTWHASRIWTLQGSSLVNDCIYVYVSSYHQTIYNILQYYITSFWKHQLTYTDGFMVPFLDTI